MTGVQEILTLFIIAAGVLILPRFFPPRKKERTAVKIKVPVNSGMFRLGVVLSFLLPAAAALILEPWRHNPLLFAGVGVLPVVIGWAGVWVMTGFKKKK